MANKRSLFERLTGAVRVDDESAYEDPRPALRSTPKTISNSLYEEAEDAQLNLDVYQTPTEIVIKTMVAGVKPEDLDVSITRDEVTIRGKRQEDRTISEEDFVHHELYWGSFSRTVSLPVEVDVDGAEAVEKYGLLILHLPKIDKNRQTRLKVRG
jgi:HSP20 family protein